MRDGWMSVRGIRNYTKCYLLGWKAGTAPPVQS